MIFFLCVLPVRSIECIETPKVKTPPIIDGILENEWTEANIVNEFFQCQPKEGEIATEQITVCIMQDKKNIYIAFKCCDSEPTKIDIKITPRDYLSSGDNIWIYLDTFGDKTTAYEFGVNSVGIQCDGRVQEDGRYTDYNWDGVWYSAAKITNYGYNVEMKIPFKTLRFRPGLTEWGINFFRFISRKNEYDSWSPIKQTEEGIRVSRCGILKGIHPGKQGLHLEVYPVTLGRYENNSLHPKIGLDLGWGPIPSSQISLTTYPDFAQIEADPYTINLSKYEIYFDEKRPFFLEGREIFDTPIKLFYSRRVGKRLYTGKEVPIIGGAKYTGTYKRFNFGLLSAYTDKISTEPKSLHSVGRIKLGVFKNSDLGILYSEDRSENNTQGVLGIDGTFRTQELQLASQFAKSDSGYAKFVQLDWYASKFLILSKYEHYDGNFDIERIGYAPWKGLTKYYLKAGPRFFNVGPFYTLTTGIGGGRKKEIGEQGWEYWINGWFSPTFKNNWGLSSNFYRGKGYEMDKWYDYYQTSISFWTDNAKPVVLSDDIWYKSYGFNYRRNYFAQMGTNNIYLEWRLNPALTLSLNLSNTLEWKRDGKIEEISWVLRPILQYALNKDIHFRIYAEPNTDTDIHSLNTLLSWNFKPKSWFYLAFNETRDNSAGKMSLKDRIVVAKIRYLFFL